MNVFCTSGRKLYAQSNLPLVTSSWLVLWLLACAGNSTCVGTTLLACQYVGFLASAYCVGANEAKVYGPVPTGFVLANFVGSATDAHRCSGTIGVCAIVPAKGTLGVLNVTVTSFPEAVIALICCHTPCRSRAGNFFSRLKVNTTSAGVKGVPSLHFTFWRIV